MNTAFSPEWRTSSYTAPESNNCVEVADLATGATAMRDSKNPARAVLTFPADEWRAFIIGACQGEV